jgi:dienelactone hydrolase
MATQTRNINIAVDNDTLAGTLVSPGTKLPGILFIHGWGGSQQRDLARAKGIAGLGCICLTFDLRGHEKTSAAYLTVNRQHSFDDILAAYDHLVRHPAVDPEAIAVIATSYGGYLAPLLAALRPVKWLALRAPALYWDEEWLLPKHALDRQKLADYRQQVIAPQGNRALAACAEFGGDVLLVESEHDDFVPHQVLMNYRLAFTKAHSLTHRLLRGADHALSSDNCQKAYTSVLTTWINEMVVGERVGNYPHESPHLS